MLIRISLGIMCLPHVYNHTSMKRRESTSSVCVETIYDDTLVEECEERGSIEHNVRNGEHNQEK